MVNFRTDKFRMESTMLEFIEEEVKARVKEFDSCVIIDGRKVAITVKIEDGCVYNYVETPFVYL